MSRLLFALAGLGLCVVSTLQAQSPRDDRASVAIAAPSTSGAAHGGASAGTSRSYASAVSEAELAGRVGVPLEAAIPTAAGLTSLQRQAEKIAREMVWGVATIKLPTYLQHESLGLLPDQGCLVTQVLPLSSAQTAGLQVGDLILEVDGTPALGCHGLPPRNLDGERCLLVQRCLLVLGEGGLREVHIAPLEALTLEASEYATADSLAGWRTMLETPLWMNQVQSPIRSLAVSEGNGLMSVSAVVACQDGDRRVELKGTRGQIAEQLQRLTPELQLALSQQLGL